MSEVAGQAPEKGQSGNFLTQSSAAGSKIDFIKQTNLASTSISLGASGLGTINLGVQIYDDTIPIFARNAQNLKSWDESFVIPYYDIFIDNNNDFNYKYGVGSSLSLGQQSISLSIQERLTPNNGYSYSATLVFINFDTSSHVVYVTIGAKYAILAAS